MRVRCDVEAGVIWSSSLHPFLPPLLFFSKKAVLPFLAFLCCIREWALACGAGSRPKNLSGLGKFTWAKGGPEPSFASTGLRPWLHAFAFAVAGLFFFFLRFFAMPFGYFLPGGLPTSTTAGTSAAAAN
jgi:hypothetical protein